MFSLRSPRPSFLDSPLRACSRENRRLAVAHLSEPSHLGRGQWPAPRWPDHDTIERVAPDDLD